MKNLLLLLLFIPATFFGQVGKKSSKNNQILDSLTNSFKNAKHDTTKLQLLVELSNVLAPINPDTIVPLANQIILLVSKNISSTSGRIKRLFLVYQAVAYGNIGYSYSNHGNIPKALEYYNLALKNQEENKDPQGIAGSLNNLGAAYFNQGNIQQSLDSYLKSFKIIEKLVSKLPNNVWLKKDIVSTMHNMASIYKQQGETDNALYYYNRCLKINEEIKDRRSTSSTLANIGSIYRDKGNLDKALELYRQCLKIDIDIEYKSGTAYSLNNIGTIYKTMSERAAYNSKPESDTLLPRAMIYFKGSLKIREEIKETQGLVYSLCNVGYVYLKQDSLQKANECGTRALSLAKQIGYPESIRYSAAFLKKIYQQQQKPAEALEMFELAVVMGDSVKNETNKKATVKKQLQYEYEKKEILLSLEKEKQKLMYNIEMKKNQLKYETAQEQQKYKSEKEKDDIAHREILKRTKLNDYFNYKKAAAKAEEEKKDMVHLAETKQQKFIITSILIGLALVLFFSVFLFNRFRITRKQNIIIEKQKAEVEKQRELADERRIIAEEQKQVIEEKQKEILDSIRYAERIQQSLLPSEKFIERKMKDLKVGKKG